MQCIALPGRPGATKRSGSHHQPRPPSSGTPAPPPSPSRVKTLGRPITPQIPGTARPVSRNATAAERPASRNAAALEITRPASRNTGALLERPVSRNAGAVPFERPVSRAAGVSPRSGRYTDESRVTEALWGSESSDKARKRRFSSGGVPGTPSHGGREAYEADHSGGPQSWTRFLRSSTKASEEATVKRKSAEMSRWRDLFGVIDSDSSGEISVSEFNRAMKDCQRFFASDMSAWTEMTKWDKNGDGAIDVEEFDIFCDKLYEALGPELFNEFKEEVIENSWEAKCVGSKMVHCIIHPEHNGFELGGRAGNIVTKVYGSTKDFRVFIDIPDASKPAVMLEKGFKAVAVNYKFCNPEDILLSMMTAHKESRTVTVTFNVPEEAAQRLGQKCIQQASKRMQLDEVLGHRSLEELETLDQGEKEKLFKQFRVQCLMVDNMAVMQLDVLLGKKSAAEVRTGIDVREALTHGDNKKLTNLLGEEKNEVTTSACLQRDGGGNVAMHYAEDFENLQMLMEHSPEAMEMKNLSQQTPLHTFLQRAGSQTEEVETLTNIMLEKKPSALLELDGSGVSPLMMLENPVRQQAQEQFPTWSEIEVVLKTTEMSELLSALDTIKPEGYWAQLLNYHCFGEAEVWKEGRHTKQSKDRLASVWETIHSALHAMFARDNDAVAALAVAKAMINATRGPKHLSLDPRAPYREELTIMCQRLEGVSAHMIDQSYGRLVVENSGEAADWLRRCGTRVINPDMETWEHLELEPRCRVKMPPPSWLSEPNLKAVFEDLESVGMIGVFHETDASYELLCIGSGHSSCPVDMVEKDFVIGRWHAALMRGKYAQNNEALLDTVRDDFMNSACSEYWEKSFAFRPEAKSLNRLNEKSLSTIQGIIRQLADQGEDLNPLQKWHFTLLSRQSAGLILDQTACRCIADTPEELRALYVALTNTSTGGIAAVENRFEVSTNTDLDPYRNVVVWREVQTDAGRLLIEVELHLRAMFDEMLWLRIASEVHRGYYDWQHLLNRIPDIIKSASERIAKALRAAMENEDIEEISYNVNKAETLGIHEELCEEAKLLKEELERKRQLQEAEDLASLQRAAEAAREAQMIIDEQTLREMELKIQQNQVLKRLQKAWEDREAKEFDAAIKSADQCELELDDEKAQRIHQFIKKVTLNKIISEAVEMKRVDNLSLALEDCEDAGWSLTETDAVVTVVGKLQSVLDSAEDSADAIIEVEKMSLHWDMRQALKKAVDSEDLEACRRAITVAKGAKLPEADMKEAMDLIREMKSKKAQGEEKEKEKDKKKPSKSLPKAIRQVVMVNRMTNRTTSKEEPAKPPPIFDIEAISEQIEEVPIMSDETERAILEWAVNFHKEHAHSVSKDPRAAASKSSAAARRNKRRGTKDDADADRYASAETAGSAQSAESAELESPYESSAA